MEAGDLRSHCRPQAHQQIATGQAHLVAGRQGRRLASDATSISSAGGSASSPHDLHADHARPGRSRRRRRPRGRRARQPLRPRVSASGATNATCRARSMSCFIVRTKSPPVSSSGPTTSASSSPAIQACAAARKPIGRPVLGQTDGPLVGGEVLARRLDPGPTPPHVGRGEPRSGRRLRAAVLVDERRQEPAQLLGVEAIEQSTVQALGDEEVRLVEDAREHAAARSAPSSRRRRRSVAAGRPARDRTPGPTTGCVPRRARRAGAALAPDARSSPPPAFAAPVRGPLPPGECHRAGHRPTPTVSGAAQLGGAERARHLAAVVGSVGVEHRRKADRADRARRRRSRRR